MTFAPLRCPRVLCRRTLVLSTVAALGLGTACAPPEPSPDQRQAYAQAFLDEYSAEFVRLYTESNEAEWAANTKIVEGDETNRKRAESANEALATFSGSEATIERTQALLEHRDQLTDLQVRQLEEVLYLAANNPGSIPELVKERITAEALQNETLFGFDFQIDGTSVTTNDIDDLLHEAEDLGQRLAAWNASKEVGVDLREGLVELVRLRNETVRPLGYDDYFAYQVSAYGMESGEMMRLLDSLVADVWPLFRELHTWTRYELAEHYGTEVPDLLPAHWLPNRWGQDWAGVVTVEGLDLDPVLAEYEPEWVVRKAEEFFQSLGFEAMPESFYETSSLYPVAADAGYSKNNHASAWHVDLQDDVRCLMSVQSNQRWWATTHHELGHIYYYMAYAQPEVPLLLRAGANRAFHEAVGTQLGMASLHRAFLEGQGLIPAGTQVDEIQVLLKEALDSVVFMPFSAGTMSHFEHDLYTGAVDPTSYNQRWWDYVARYQGIAPPEDRGETYCDACTKTHINNDAAQYYDYALSYVILHQLHDHVASEILGQDPRNTNYYGSTETGEFLNDILSLGATQDWRQVMKDHLGQEISAKPMLDYFAPLLAYLQQQNQGREHSLPETPAG